MHTISFINTSKLAAKSKTLSCAIIGQTVTLAFPTENHCEQCAEYYDIKFFVIEEIIS